MRTAARIAAPIHTVDSFANLLPHNTKRNDMIKGNDIIQHNQMQNFYIYEELHPCFVLRP
jgi:hypothetical protein